MTENRVADAGLYAPDPLDRLRAAKSFRPFASDPDYRGDPWPEVVAGLAARWPMFMFGSANAWMLFVAPNPGDSGLSVTDPPGPTLGSEPHPHVASFKHPSWTRIRRLVAGAFAPALSAHDALAQFMLVNLSERNSKRSTYGEHYDDSGFRRLERALDLCQPHLLVAQNEEIYALIKRKLNIVGNEVFAQSHNQVLNPRGRVTVARQGRLMLLAQAESHFAQGWSEWSIRTYLPLLVGEASRLG